MRGWGRTEATPALGVSGYPRLEELRSISSRLQPYNQRQILWLWFVETMPLCCRCNGGGKCRNCVCAKAKRQCTSCLPSRRGCCSNIMRMTASPAIVPVQDLPASPNTDISQVAPSPAPARSCDLTSIPNEAVASGRGCLLPTVSPNAAILIPNNAHSLPPPTPMANPSFVCGMLDAETFMHSVTAAYAEVVHWRRNTFSVPYGSAGKKFVSELSKLYRAYAEGSALEPIALKATTVMSLLLLQKPSRNSKSRDHSACLERRLRAWTEGDINNLILEGRTLQNRLPKISSSTNDEKNLVRAFSNLMFKGKTSAAL